MLIIYKAQANLLTVTATELATEANPIFLWEFTHHQSGEQLSAVLQNESLSPQRYDEFVIDEGNTLEFPYTGDYTYRIKEQQTGVLLEVGRLVVKEAKTPDNTYNDSQIDTIYNGETTN
jgi:hypothetical protein